ncbi:hypothetical protein PS2_033346 [Malus domestica]
MAHAPLVTSVKVCAITATSNRGICKGPTVCCGATRPVTHLSTLDVKKRFEQTDGGLNTLLSESITVIPRAISSGSRASIILWNSKLFCGISPSTFSSSKSTAGGGGEIPLDSHF